MYRGMHAKQGDQMSSEQQNTSYAFDEAAAESYVLGEMSQPEMDEFEEAYFSDDRIFNRFVAVKTDILDLYNRNELDHDRRRRLELAFQAIPARRAAFQESQDFIRLVTKISSSPSAGAMEEPSPVNESQGFWQSLRVAASPQFAFAALMVLVGGGLIALWEYRRAVLPNDISQLSESAYAINTNQMLREMSTAEPRSRAGALLIAGRISDQLRRNVVTLYHDTENVRLNMHLDKGSFQGFGCSLSTYAGQALTAISRVSLSDTKLFTVDVNAALLKKGSYKLRIFGDRGGKSVLLNEYAFRVDKPSN